MTQEQQEELNAYLVQLLNSARTVLGTADLAGNVVGSVGANAAASEIAVGYRNDRWNSFVNHHDNAAVNSVAKKYGLAVPENSSGQLIENLHTLLMGKFADQDHINMYDAKKSVYKGVIDMFFDDYKKGAGNPEKLEEAFRRSIPLGRIGQPDDLPGAIVFFASDDAAFVTGQVLSVSGGLTMAG